MAERVPRRFVVTGCGRSGTLYTATVLTRSGIACGHEEVFEPPLRGAPDFGALQGDVSWAAAPYLDRLPADTVVLHQVRQPQDVIRSYVDFAFFDRRPRRTLRYDVLHPLRRAGRRVTGRARLAATTAAYQRLTTEWTPDVWRESTPVARSARFWVRWNGLVEGSAGALGLPYLRFRVEDLEHQLPAIFDMIGAEPTGDAAAIARSVPPSTNRKGTPSTLSWSTVPPEAREAVDELAVRYGYPR